MKKLLILLLFTIPALAVAQTVNFEDGFSDQDISDWSGDVANFTFIDESGNILLQQDAPDAGTSYLSIPSTNVEGYWEFFVRMDFAPSDGNKTEIYLMSDVSDFSSSSINGYKILAGENGSEDVFRLLRLDNGTETEVIAGTINISAGGDFRVKVTRDAAGNWTLEAATGYAGILSEEGTAIDNTYASASYFGFKTTYTSTRSDLFAFDFKIDIPPVEVSSVSPVNATDIDVSFSRDIDFGTAQLSDFTLFPENINPQSITQQSSDVVRISFANNINSGENELSITDINDATGETTLADTTFSFVIFDNYQPGDIVINEFLKDPPTGTTEEYVELKNTSNRYLNIRDWQIGDNTSLTSISTTDLAVLPDSFAVITSDTASISSIFGNGNYIQVSLPALNNGEDQIRVYNQNGNLIDSLTYTTDWGGEDVAIERRDENVSSIFRENWGDSPAPNFGTPGFTNLIEPDNMPPELLEIERSASDQIQLTFSERLQQIPAENTANFELTSNNLDVSVPSLQSATFLSPEIIILQYNTDLPSEPEGTTYELAIANQTDIFGNVSDQIIESFFIIEYGSARSADVIVTEFMYDPATGFTDFIELYNTSTSAFNLQGWTYNDNSGNRRTISNEEIALAPGSYIVLAPDSTILLSFPEIALIDMGSSFANLNSTTPDNIVIRDQSGTLIDSLTYNSDWGGTEISLERRSNNAPSIYKENWGNSPSPDLATPGTANQVAADNDPPEIISSFIPAPDSIRIIFNERVDSLLAKNTSNYSLSPSVFISQIAHFSGNALTLALGSPLTDGETYTLTIENQQDIFGNLLTSAFTELVYTEFSPSTYGDVIVNEILYRRARAGSEEFVELYNRTDQNFDLSNWIFQDATGSSTIPNGTQIRGGEFVVLTGLESFANEIEDAVFLSGFPALNDDEDAIVIRNQDGTLIDSLFYSNIWGGNERGVSLERKDPQSASNDASNWSSSTSNYRNTAGNENSIYEPDVTPPEILFSKLQSDGTIFVAFTEFVNINNAAASINNQPAPIIRYNETDANIVILENPVEASAKAKSRKNQPLRLVFTNITDFRGNANSELSVEVSQSLMPGTVVINEILYNPLANSDDNLPDQTEYIELYNRADHAVSLEGFSLHDEPDENNLVRSLYPVSSQYKWIPAGGYVIVYADDQAASFGESQLAEYFELQSEDDQFKVRVDRTSLSLANTDDAIYLADSTGATIDSVFYNESWQNPNLYNTDGIALERIDPSGPSNDQSNWSSSTRVSGGTPGEQNSIFQQG
ncbi:MAG TPA: lamin tail domain-containing protein, partial [Gracilimonas sp.]|uniref:lamin tail domain-containing protein n=1 Tax=Gracilimonas sp. TaxID=1974203 RepID=UPI002DAEED87|nr:lamin tail domain-containing protein [Gracilimonas sp.]